MEEGRESGGKQEGASERSISARFCPLPVPLQLEARLLEGARRHRLRAHGGREVQDKASEVHDRLSHVHDKLSYVFDGGGS